MGQSISNSQSVIPYSVRGAIPANDPLYGFDEGRRVREPPKATPEEMRSAGLAHWQMDYCADQLIDLLKCHREAGLWPFTCRYLKHAYDDCEMEDFQIRLLRAEREKRLKMRERRKEGLQELENPVVHHIWGNMFPFMRVRPKAYPEKNQYPYPRTNSHH